MNILPEPTKIIELDLPNVMKKSLIITIFSFLFLIGVHIYQVGFEFHISFWTFLFFFIGYIMLIILHEFFHLLGFRIFAHVPWKSMKVGVDLKQGIAYATTDQLMENKPLRKALLLPFWMTGVVPAVIGLVIENGLLLTLASFLIGGASGDFMMYKELKKLPDNILIKDDPQEPKLYIYNREDLNTTTDS